MKHKGPASVAVPGPAGRLLTSVEGEGGIPVLFVHDNAADRTHWAEVQHDLHTRSLALDLRGLGESDGGHGPFGVETAVEDIAAVADALLASRFVLVGHGFGAAAAGAFASYYPERLAGLLYVEAGGDLRGLTPAQADALLEGFSAEKYGAFHEHWLSPLLTGAKDSTRKQVMKTLRTSRREAVAGYQASLLGYDPHEAFERFQGPTHALAATTGPGSLVAQRPTLSRTVLPHTSHWLMLDSPQAFHTELVRFLARCKAGPG